MFWKMKSGKAGSGTYGGRLGITSEEEEGFVAREADFQKFVTGRYKSMGEMRELIGFRTMERKNGCISLTALRKRNGFSSIWIGERAIARKMLIFLQDAYDGSM